MITRNPVFAKVIGIFKAIRIVNSCAVFVATFVGGLLSIGAQILSGASQLLLKGGEPLPESGELLYGRGTLHTAAPEFSMVAQAAATASLLAAFGYSLNDYYDVRADETNRPSRPIPSGILSRESVLGVAVVCALAAALFALRLGLLMQLILAGVCTVVWLYNARLKRTGLAGNVVVSLLAGLALLYGGMAAGDMRPTLFPALLAFLVNLPREILKDVQDLEGDLLVNSRSVASVRGEGFALRLASVFVCVLAVVSLIPCGVGLYNRYYLAIVLLLDALWVWMAVTLWRTGSLTKVGSGSEVASSSKLVSQEIPVSKDRSEIDRRVEIAIRVLKLTMLAGILAIVMGSL